jgi:phosphoribosylformylglycinamidine (FGAM) synthase-like amidotransferase family enzyme
MGDGNVGLARFSVSAGECGVGVDDGEGNILAGEFEASVSQQGAGRFVADEDTLDRLEGGGRVVFRYLDNPNGSARDIAAIVNERGNVMGLMPHPERASDPALGRTGGAALFQSLLEAA